MLYHVEVYVSGLWEGDVEADSEEDAISSGCEMAGCETYFDYEVERIYPVKEDE